MIDLTIPPPNPNEPREQIRRAHEYIDANLAAACIEILEWEDTGFLRDGVLRAAAALMPFSDEGNALRMAESFAKTGAMEFVVNHQHGP